MRHVVNATPAAVGSVRATADATVLLLLDKTHDPKTHAKQRHIRKL